MTDQAFSQKLREIRLKSGKSVPEVSEYLTSQGIKAAQQTVYGWERGQSQPKPNTLLKMCEFYGVEDVLGAFGLSNDAQAEETTAPIQFPMERLEALVNQLTEEQACFMVQVVEAILRKNPKAYAAARAENRRLWEGE